MSPAADPRAHAQVARALLDGRLVKPKHCEECGRFVETSRNLHAHHDDYSQPLIVRWLCPRCHRRTPRGINGRDDLTDNHLSVRLDELTGRELAELVAYFAANFGDSSSSQVLRTAIHRLYEATLETKP